MTRSVAQGSSSIVVEVLSFDGCPHVDETRTLVEQVARELGVAIEIVSVNVVDTDAAARLRFLGSPTVRVAGKDIEPGADEREDFALSCRVYRSGTAVGGIPPRAYIRDALAHAAAEAIDQ